MAPVLIAKVALENVSYHFDKAYDYCVPESLRERARPGCRVSVLRKNRPVGSSSFPACWMKSLF